MTRAVVALLCAALGFLPAQDGVAQDGAAAVPAPTALAVSDELRVVVTAPATVDFGTEFKLVIERSWPRSHSPQPFDPLRLLPLATTEMETRVTPVGERLVELRRYRATMWRVGEFELGPFELRTKDSDGQLWRSDSRSGPTRLAVRSVLPEPAGPIEWPGDVRERARGATWPWWVGIGLAVAITGFGYRHWRRTRPEPMPEAPPEPSPRELAHAELGALATPAEDAGAAAVEGYYIALAEIVRRYATRAFGVDAVVHTTPELVAVVPLGGDPLRECLFVCDLVKFAADRPLATAHETAKERARSFVDAEESPRAAVGSPVGAAS